NGQTYTTSGTYTDVSTNAVGCAHTDTLNLTINNSTTASSSITVCDSFTWNSQVITSSGSYNQTFTNSVGCDSVHTLVAIINNSNTGTVPDIGAVDTIVCEGEDIQLLTSTNAFKYCWIGPNGFGSALQNPIVYTATYMEGGLYELHVEDSMGCASKDTSIYIDVPYPPYDPDISGGGNICSGTSFTLTESFTFADSLLWIGPVHNQMAIGTSIQVLPSDSNYVTGIWTVRNIDAYSGCYSESPPIFVNLVSTPTTPLITSSGAICIGESVDLSVPIVVNAVVNWYADTSKTILLGTGSNITVPNITLDTTFYVEYLVNGCTSPLASISISPNNLPATPDVSADFSVCEGENINLFTSIDSIDCNQYKIDNIPFLPVAGSGTSITLSDDELSSNLPIGFSFDFYCSTYSQFRISSNGYITFDLSTLNNGCCTGQNIPNNLDPNNLIALAWEDLNPASGGTINYFTTGAAPNRKLVVNYINIPRFGGANNVTGQIVLHEGTNYIDVYTTTVLPEGNTTQGIENIDGTLAATIPGRNSSVWSASNDAYRFSIGSNSYNWSHTNGFTSSQKTPTIVAANSSNAGVYTLNVSDANGCTSPDTIVNVTVNSNPTSPIITAPANVCFGDSIFFTASSFCGDNRWIGPAGGVYLATSANFTVPPSSADYINGNWYMICVDTNFSCSSISNTVNVTINSPPVPPGVFNSGPVCIGNSVDLTAALIANANYNWYADSLLSNFVVNGSYPTIPNITTDSTFYLEVELNGCFSYNSTQVIVLPVSAQPNITPDFDVCEGESILLETTTPAYSHQWISPSGVIYSDSVIFIPAANLLDQGDYYLSIIDTNDCVVPDTSVFVTVNPKPLSPTITSAPICQGENLVLYVTSGCDSILWTGPSGIPFVAGDTIIVLSTDVNYIDGGSWTAICIDTNTNCISNPSPIHNVTINTVLPVSSVINDGPVCIGDAVQLTTPLVASATYNWYLMDTVTLIGSGPTITVSNITADTTFLLVITVNGCDVYDSTQVFVLQPPALPSVPSSLSLCANDTLFLTTTTIASGYNWTGPQGFSSSSQNPQIYPVSSSNSGIYTLSVLDANLCESSDTTILVTVNSLPSSPIIFSAGPSTVCFGDSIKIFSNFNCDQSIWSSPSGNTIFADSIIIDSLNPDYATGDWNMICVDTSTGCQSNSNTLNIVIKPIPSVPIITHNAPVCIGDSVDLTMQIVTNGTYEWYNIDDTLMGTTYTINVPGINQDSAFLGVVTVNGCSAQDSVLILVNSVPATPDISALSDTICEFDLLQLNTTTISSTYNWTGPNGFSSNLISPSISSADVLSSGTYYLNVLDSNSCPSLDTSISIFVNILPSQPLITGSASICDGDTIILQAGTCDKLNWFSPTSGSQITTSSSSLQIPSNSPDYLSGIWVVNCEDTLTGCLSPSSLNHTITINTLPASVTPTNDGPICINGSVSLSIAQQTASTYLWSSDSLMNDTIGLGTSIFVDSISTDSTFYVQITNSSGCVAIGSTVVTVSSGPPIPAIITTDTFVCEGDDIQLATNVTGVFYFWSGPNGFISNQASPLLTTVSVSEGGVYSLFTEDASGCASPADSILIVINSPPIIPIISGGTNVCYGDTVLLTSSVSCDSSEWIGNSGGFLIQNVLGQLEITVSDPQYINTDWTLICHDTSTGCYSSSNTAFVTILSQPGQPSIANSGPVCHADSVLLSTPSIMNATNFWYADSLLTIPIDTGDIVTVYNITTDSTFYLQQIYNGCVAPVASTNVTHLNILSAPIVPFGITICEGDDINLTTTTIANSYLWTHVGGFTSTLQNPVIPSATLSDSGVYDLTVIDTNGCIAPGTSIPVTVNSLLTAPVILVNDSICEGNPISLGSNTPVNVEIEWVTPNNDTIAGNPGLIILSSDTNYISGLWTLVFKDTITGCQLTSDTVINFISAPIPGIVSVNDPICVGDTLHLSTTTIVSATSYNWKTMDSILLGNGQNINIPDIVSDTSFLLFVSSSQGCVFLMDSISVSVYPQSSAPPITVDTLNCVGDAIQFTTNPAVAYSWVGPNGFSSTIQNPLIVAATQNDSGVYTLAITDLNGCVSLDSTISIHVNSLPAAPVANVLSDICVGDTLFLSSNASVCDTSYWLGPTTILQGANLAISSANSAYQSGDWQVFCVDTTTGCEEGSNIVNVSINSLPVSVAVNNGPVCLNESVQLTGGLIPSVSYDWYSDVNLTAFVDSLRVIQVDSIYSDSTFYLVVSDSNGCSSVSLTTVNLIIPAAPPLIGADINLCAGDDINLTTSTVAFGYNWSGPNNYTSNQQNPVIPSAVLADSGTYFLSVVDSFGCNSLDTSFLVIIDTLPLQPVISSFVDICDGDTLFLNATSTSNHCDSLVWIGPNGHNFPVLANNPVILPSDTNYIGGLWQLHCIDTSTGCSSGSNFCLVVISTSPDTQAVFTDSPVCYGDNVSLSTVSAGALASYTWYGDSSLTNIAGVGQYITVNGMTNDSTFYLVVTNSSGCSSQPISADVFVLSVNSPPPSAPDYQLCEGDSIQLSTGNTGIGYLWVSSNGYVDTTQAPLVTMAATVLDSGEYKCYVTDSNGCVYLDTWFNLVINTAPPNPTITTNAPLCLGDTLNITSGSQCIQSQWIGPNGNSPAVLGSPGGGNVLWTYGSTTSIPPSNSNYLSGDWYMICIDTLTGCQSISDTINISIDTTPTVLSVSNSGPVCSGDNVDLTISALSTSGAPLIVTWYSDVNLTTVVGIGDTTFVPNVASSTVYYVQMIDSQTGCSSLDSTTVTVNTLPSPPILPSDAILCEGDSIFLSTVTIAPNYIWSGPNGFSSTSQNPTPFVSSVIDSGTYSLQIIDAAGCLSAIETIHLTINPTPPIPIISNSGPGCVGDSIVFNASSIPGASFTWFKLPLGSGVWPGQSMTLTNLTLADTGYYYVVANIANCTSYSDTVFVDVVSNSLTNPIAGLDQTICGYDTLTLFGSTPPINATGMWSTNSSAVIVSPNTSSTLLANLPVGTSVFYWTFTNTICSGSSVDSVIITVLPQSPDIAFAGTDQYLCGDSLATLSASAPIVSVGSWTQSPTQASLGVNIISTNDPTTSITGLISGNTFQFVWVLTNGICGVHSTDTVNIDVSIAPTDIAFAGGDIITCTLDTLILSATNPSIGTGMWSTNSSAVIINPNQNNTIVTNLLQDTTMFIWTLSNVACTNYSSDTMMVMLGGDIPIANPDSFAVMSGSTLIVNVLSNDSLTSSWDINISIPMQSGQLINLYNGDFDIDFQGVISDQYFVYEICNPACPTFCDTALVSLELLPVGSCVIPNIFTPNGDGVNDVFEIPCLYNTQGTSLLVFNRWGDMVYETDNYQNQWDGTHNGNHLPDGTYFYIIKIGTDEKSQGSVEIRR
ncbi:MAG: gliding motility-associated C-terminal domain-containing protein, partial [Saprospiraceae bacterium]|nr:gliding motility-associated C-terminal domain-containing protein [Saprospiraceae bacterium]